jgi:PAS domain S-box-containing protein
MTSARGSAAVGAMLAPSAERRKPGRAAGQARASQIVGSAPDAITSSDRRDRFTSWNSGAEELYGYSETEVLGKPASFIIPAECREAHRELFKRVMDGEAIELHETSRLRKDGSTVDVSLTLFALRDPRGAIVGAASIARDTSARIAAERGLRESESRYRQLLEAAYEGVWCIDANMVTDYANRRMAEMLGYSVEEMLGRGLSEFLDADGLRFAEASTERQRRGAKERLEVSFLRKDGSTLEALISVNALFDEAGGYAGNVAMVTDVSEQRRAEEQHRETKTFLADVTASMDEGLLTLDASGRMATVNDAALEMLGYQEDELIGRMPCDSLGCRRGDGHPCPAGQCRLAVIHSSAAPIRLEDAALTRSDGTSLPVALSGAPLAEGGGSVGHLVIFQDVSERDAAAERARAELDEISWIGRLRDAMDEGRLVLGAQPIVSLATGEMTSQELLVRLRDRNGLLVLPGEFLPAAERFGLVQELDRWVVGQAAALAAQGQAINVNLSAHSLGDPKLAALIEQMLQEQGADPALITFEITETALTDHPRLAARFAEHMAALGCRFALDDFGTGYGFFTYLKLLPINYLKIDREFVHDLSENPASKHVVEAMVSLARGFGQRTVAEGVEDERTLEMLCELGVDHAQGYYIAPPGGAVRSATGPNPEP